MKYWSDKTFLKAIMAISFVIMIMMFMTSCTTYKKFQRYGDNHTDSAASYCASRYPVKVETIINTVTKEGKPVIQQIPGETVYINCDSAIASAWDEASRKHIGVQCPPSKIIHTTDTVYKEVTKVEENTAKVSYLQQQLENQTKLSEKYKAGEDSNRKIATREGIALAALVIALIVSLYFHVKNSFKNIV